MRLHLFIDNKRLQSPKTRRRRRTRAGSARNCRIEIESNICTKISSIEMGANINSPNSLHLGAGTTGSSSRIYFRGSKNPSKTWSTRFNGSGTRLVPGSFQLFTPHVWMKTRLEARAWLGDSGRDHLVDSTSTSYLLQLHLMRTQIQKHS